MDYLGMTEYLRPIAGIGTITVPPCNGRHRIFDATPVFPGGIDPAFSELRVGRDQSYTPRTMLQIYEQRCTATAGQLFCSLSDDRDRLCLTQPQIVSFCANQPGLLARNAPTFFLFGSGNFFFVAIVNLSKRDGSDVRAQLGRLSHTALWFMKDDQRARVIVPYSS